MNAMSQAKQKHLMRIADVFAFVIAMTTLIPKTQNINHVIKESFACTNWFGN